MSSAQGGSDTLVGGGGDDTYVLRMTTDTWAMSVKPVVSNGSYQFREAF